MSGLYDRCIFDELRIEMTFIVGIVNILFVSYIFYRVWKNQHSALRKFFWPALLLKVIAGICIGLLYTYYYTIGDTFTYFNDGTKLAAMARSEPLTYLQFLWAGNETFTIWANLVFQEPRALFMVKITSILNLLTADNYWIISLYFSSISFLCSWLLVRTLVSMNAQFKNSAVFAFLFFPSVVFWTSGVVKESLAMAALFFITAVFIQVWLKQKVKLPFWILLPLAFWILWMLKYYYVAVFFPIAATCSFTQVILLPLLPKKLQSWKILLWFLVLIIPVGIITSIHPNFYPTRFLTVIVSNYEAYHAISNPEDTIHYTTLRATWVSILINSPFALLSGLFRPFPWQAGTIFQLLLSLENSLLVLLSVTALKNIRSVMASPYRMLVLALLLYTVILCVFLALSTPNFGTLSRYRVGFLPYFVFLITVENNWFITTTQYIQRSFYRLVR